MPIDYATLKAEIEDDPKSLSYAGKTDPPIAELLNTIELSNETIDVGVIDGQELQKCVVIGEYTLLSEAARQAWTTILSAGDGQVNVDDSRVVDQIAAIWGSGTTTRTNLMTLRTRRASRAEVLFGIGVSVSHLDVGRALRW